MRKIIKLNTYGKREIANIIAESGLMPVQRKYNHDKYTAAGIVTSPKNSENVYIDVYNDRYYIFNGWESGEFGRMVNDPAFIEMIDITDLVEFAPLTSYRVTYSDGSKQSKSMAAGVTLADAQKYFVGQWVNFGDVDGPDVMRQAVSVEAIP
jgi:hypothetical protein